MASNEIELTFIRCPSCKSLMPSTAHKCGMCGLNMDSEEEVQPERKLRLRQSSMTNVGSLFEEDNSEPAKEDLGATEEIVKPILPIQFSTEYGEDFSEDVGGEDGDDSAYETVEEPVKRKRKRRRKKKKAPLLENTIEVEDDTKQVEMTEVEAVYFEEDLDPFLKTEVGKTTYESLSSFHTNDKRNEEPVVTALAKEESHVSNQNNDRKDNMSNGNRLLGWFVNYSTDESGKSFEIRVGKKFIGRQQLRPHDLLIPDSAISTPHCLLNAEYGKLSLQDLMSDQGTFVKQIGDADFKKIDSTVQLNHGDILRLGSFELVVCLIPIN